MAVSGVYEKNITSWLKLRLTWTSNYQSVTQNLTNVTAAAYLVCTSSIGEVKSSAQKKITLTINGESFSYTKAGLAAISGQTTKKLFEKTVDIEHTSDGTQKINVSCSFNFEVTLRGDYYGTITVSGSDSLKTILVTSTISTTGGKLGEKQTITLKRQSSNYTDTVTYKCGNASGTIATKTSAASLNFTPPVTLAAQNPNGASVQITYTVTTYSGSTAIGSRSTAYTYSIPDDVVPTVSSFTLSEATEGLSEQFGAYVSGKSKISWNITAAGAQGSSIKTYDVRIAGQIFTTKSGTTELINSSAGLQKATVTVTDSRGRTAKSETTFYVFNYKTPQFSEFSAYRTTDGVNLDDEGTVLRLWLNFNVSSMDGKNPVSFNISYRIAGGTNSFTALPHGVSANTYTFNSAVIYNLETDPTFSTDNAYEICFKITDFFGTTEKYATIPTGVTVFDILNDGSGICLGGVAKESKTLDVSRWRIITAAKHIKAGANPLEDLNNYKTPGVYEGSASSNDEALIQNCPLKNGTFTLEVFNAGSNGQTMQRLTFCDKDNPLIYVRHYYFEAWGDWTCVYDSKIGTAQSQTKAAKITSTNIDTSVTGASLELAAGSYLIIGTAGFSAVGTSSRNLQVSIFKGDTDISWERVHSATSYYANLTTTCFCELKTTATLSVRKSATVAESEVANTTLTAIRLK